MFKATIETIVVKEDLYHNLPFVYLSILLLFSIHEGGYSGISVSTSVADPDPVGSGLFWSPGSGSGKKTGSGSGSFIHKKTPCYSNFLVIKLSKTQFRPNNFLTFDFKRHNSFLSLILSVI